MAIGFDMKALFFDSKAVMDATDRATRKVLSKFGYLVRKSARASVKEAAGSSSAGQPPHSHMRARRRRLNAKRRSEGKEPVKKGFEGLRYILFSFNPESRSVIIGPASNRTRSMTIPEILEYGEKDPRVAARPFMGPAFEKEQKSLPSLWGNSIK